MPQVWSPPAAMRAHGAPELIRPVTLCCPVPAEAWPVAGPPGCWAATAGIAGAARLTASPPAAATAAPAQASRTAAADRRAGLVREFRIPPRIICQFTLSLPGE